MDLSEDLSTFLGKMGRTIGFLVMMALPCFAYSQMPGGIPSYQSGGTFHHLGMEVSIPDDYKVLDVKSLSGRVIVVALFVYEPGESDHQYRSEVWQFTPSRGNPKASTFDSRQVLASFESSEGEQQRLCFESVICPATTAVFVRGWEGGSILLFNRAGTEVEVEWVPSNLDFGNLRGDYVRPMGWLEVIEGGKVSYQLACSLYDEGGKRPYVGIYDLAGGETEILPASSVSSEIYWELAQNQRRWQ